MVGSDTTRNDRTNFAPRDRVLVAFFLADVVVVSHMRTCSYALYKTEPGLPTRNGTEQPARPFSNSFYQRTEQFKPFA